MDWPEELAIVRAIDEGQFAERKQNSGLVKQQEPIVENRVLVMNEDGGTRFRAWLLLRRRASMRTTIYNFIDKKDWK